MDYQQVIEQMSPQVYQSLRRSVELGKWPDGRTITPEQRASAMQAIIAWGELHLPPEQRIGYIDKGSKAGSSCDDPEPVPLRWGNGTEGQQQ
ncbi:MAG TPA: DUF1315 family protein [Kineobactrum sp.]